MRFVIHSINITDFAWYQCSLGGHHRSVVYSAEQVVLNKRQIYGGAPKVNCYQKKK